MDIFYIPVPFPLTKLWCLEPGCFLIFRWSFETLNHICSERMEESAHVCDESPPKSWRRILTKMFNFESTERSLSSFRNRETRLLTRSRIGEKPRLIALRWQERTCTHTQKRNKGNLKRFWPDRFQKSCVFFWWLRKFPLFWGFNIFLIFLEDANPQLYMPNPYSYRMRWFQWDLSGWPVGNEGSWIPITMNRFGPGNYWDSFSDHPSVETNLLLTGHVSEIHLEGVIPSSFPNKFLLGSWGDFHFSILDYWTIKMWVWNFTCFFFFRVELEIESNNWRVSGRIPWKCSTDVFSTHLWRKKNAPAIHHVRVMPSNPPAHWKRTAAQRLPLHCDPRHGTWGVTEFPPVSIQLDVKSILANALCMFHMFSRKGTFTKGALRKRCDNVESKKGSKAAGMK